HQPNGTGVDGMIPALAGNPAVLAQGPQNVIRVVLGGLEASHGFAPMPAVGSGLSDGDVAAVANYIRTSWGNKAPPTTEAGTVADLRVKTRTLLAGNLVDGCPSIANPELAKAVASESGQLKGIKLTNMLPRIQAILPNVRKSGAKDDE